MTKSVFIPFVFILPGVFAQQFSNNPLKRYEGEGRLVTVRVVPGDKTAKIYLAGKKGVQLDLKKDAKLVSVSSVHPVTGHVEELHFTPDGEAYVIDEFPKRKNMKLDIRADVKGEADHVELDLNKL